MAKKIETFVFLGPPNEDTQRSVRPEVHVSAKMKLHPQLKVKDRIEIFSFTENAEIFYKDNLYREI